MEPDRWQNLERLYHAALQRNEGQVHSFLDEACGQDQSLRVELESLLKYGQRPAKFFDKPAFEVVAETLAEDISADEENTTDKLIGARVGQYHIVAKLGAGGMGDVYREYRPATGRRRRRRRSPLLCDGAHRRQANR